MCGPWNMHNMPWLYTVEQGKNRDRSDACDIWYLFPFLGMTFFSNEPLSPQEFFSGHQKTEMVPFLIRCFLLSCTS